MKEVYKSIPGWSNFLISNRGNVKSIDRFEPFMDSQRVRCGRTMKKRIVRLYYIVGLKQGKQNKTFFVHRLVAQMFVDNPNNYPVVNHKDNNRLNNNAWNLGWCTQKMNIQHAMKNDTWTRGINHGMSKLTEKEVLEIRDFEKGSHALAAQFSISYGQLKRIRARTSWKHI